MAVSRHSRPVVDPAVLKQAVSLASRAPSLHNSQPWTWVSDGAQLELYLDRSRIVRYTDPAGREALISCGAMLDHLRVAMAAGGWDSVVQRFPNPNNLTHLVTVEFERAGQVSQATRTRASAILDRRTDRLPFRPPEAWGALETALRVLLDPVDVRLDVVDDDFRDHLIEASRATAAARRFDPQYVSELDWWTAPFELDEGIPRSALTTVTETDRVPVNRTFPAHGTGERRAGTGPDRAIILVLSTPEDTREDALTAGEAMSTVLLECTAAGLSTCPVTHLTELDSGVAVLQEMLGTDWRPQVLLRVGRAPQLDQAPPLTPRRQLSDILKFRS